MRGWVCVLCFIACAVTAPAVEFFDFDGDGTNDRAVYWPRDAEWSIKMASGAQTSIQFGVMRQIPVPADYDGDGKTDLAVYTPAETVTNRYPYPLGSQTTPAKYPDATVSSWPWAWKYPIAKQTNWTEPTYWGKWYISLSASNEVVKYSNWGSFAFVPAPGDYDGDGCADLGLYDPGSGNWYVHRLKDPANSNYAFAANWGWASTNLIPVPGDYNSNGTCDFAVFDRSIGNWYAREVNGTVIMLGTNWGWSGLIPVPADYDGDGACDLGVVWRTTNGNAYWYAREVDGNVLMMGTNWGWFATEPVPGNYNGKGGCDLGVYCTNDGVWWAETRGGKLLISNSVWGTDVEIPVSYPISIPRLMADYNEPPVSSGTPAITNWMDDLIIYFLQLRRATTNTVGLLASASNHLDYLQDLGVTAIHLNPITAWYEGENNIEFGVVDHSVLDSRVGTTNDLKGFVAGAHQRGIRVLMTLVPHGVWPTNVLIQSHLDWCHWDYLGTTTNILQVWSEMYEFDFTHPALKRWWIDNALMWVREYGIDGFACDLEPGPSGYDVWKDVIAEAAEKLHTNVFVISEHPTPTRYSCFHAGGGDISMDETRIPYVGFFGSSTNKIVDEVKKTNRTDRYYTSSLTSADRSYADGFYAVRGRDVYFTYGCLISPFIPVWYMGDEFNASVEPAVAGCTSCTLYHSHIDWSERDVNTNFLAKVKKIIQIRKQYKGIIAPSRDRLMDTSIIAVPAGGTDLQAYAMWTNHAAIVVVGKEEAANGLVSLSIPVATMGMNDHTYFRVTDLMDTSQCSTQWNVSGSVSFSYIVNSNSAAILKLDAL